MNQPNAGPSSRPGGAGPRTGRPGAAGVQLSAGSTVPAAAHPDTDTDLLLQAVEGELPSLDRLSVPDQVSVYDRMHTTLADALARTADTAPPAGPGDPGA